MRLRILIGSALSVSALILFTGCDNLSPPLSEGTITGTGKVDFALLESERLWFNYGSVFYGYVELSYYSYGVEISAPYGIYTTTADYDTAPPDTGGIYKTGDISLDYGYTYFFRPDSTHFGKLYPIEIKESDDSCEVTLEWYLQTEKGRRDFR